MPKIYTTGDINEFPNYNFSYVRADDYKALEAAFSRWKGETSKDIARISELNAAAICVCGHSGQWHEDACNYGKHAAKCPCKQFRTPADTEGVKP